MKWKKIIYIIATSIIIFLLLYAVTYNIDIKRAQKDKQPIFVVKVNSYEDGGSTDYLGLGYKIHIINSSYSKKIVIHALTLEGYRTVGVFLKRVAEFDPLQETN